MNRQCFHTFVVVLFALVSIRAKPQLLPVNSPGPATFSLLTDREPVASLDGQWRFHPGDDLHWADPGFDDSAWPLLRSDQPWSTQGYNGLSGFAGGAIIHAQIKTRCIRFYTSQHQRPAALCARRSKVVDELKFQRVCHGRDQSALLR